MGGEGARSARRLLTIAVLSAAIASVANLAGGIVFHSRILVINGLTCVANLVTAVVGSEYYIRSLQPPDADHPLGHAGYGFSSAAFTLIVYAFVLGLGIDEVANPTPYRVSGFAWTVPAGVAALYTASVLASRRVGGAAKVYADVTTSEIAESLVALVVTPLAHSYGYLVDRAGALAMLLYLAYQVASNTRGLLYELSLPSPPKSLVDSIRRDLSAMGYEVRDIRLRTVGPQVAGYAVVLMPPRESVEEAHRRADEIERFVKLKYNVDLVVHVEPREPKETLNR